MLVAERAAAARPTRAHAPRHLVVVNSRASGVRPDHVARLRAEFARWGARVETLVTASTREWIEAAAEDPDRRVVLVGGDGTLHAVVNAGTALPAIALVPAGRANNVARSLGIPLDVRAAVRLAVAGEVKPIDLVEAETDADRRVVVEGISVGYLACARARYHAENSAAAVAACAAGAAALTVFHPLGLRVRGPAEEEELSVAQLFVANLQLYAFGLRVAPGADPEDGLLDFVAVEAAGRLDVLSMILRLRSAHGAGGDGVHRWQAPRGRLVTGGLSPVIADSYDLGAGPVEVRALPSALPLVRP